MQQLFHMLFWFLFGGYSLERNAAEQTPIFNDRFPGIVESGEHYGPFDLKLLHNNDRI